MSPDHAVESENPIAAAIDAALIEPCASPRNPISGAFSKKCATSEWRRKFPVDDCLALG
jgi:hypothetical protein